MIYFKIHAQACVAVALLLAMTCSVVTYAAEVIPGTIIKRGNIRYGPNLKADVICTLNAESKIEIISRAEGLQNWYKIKFPRQGHAWMHKRNLIKTTGRMMRVTLDGAIVRSDATTSGDVVAELRLNDIVEWKGPQVGSWYAVFVSTAVAYVHQSVVMVDQPVAAASQIAGNADIVEHSAVRVVPPAEISHPAGTLWKQAKITYEQYYAILQSDRNKGMAQDWAGLSRTLSKIVADHPQLKTKVYAERLRKGIARLVSGVPVSEAVKPPAQKPAHADIIVKEPRVAVKTNPPMTVNTDSVVPVVVEVIESGTEDIVGFSKTENGVVGWLQNMEIDSIGVQYVILGDSGIAAFIKLKEGSTINLKTMHWRRVIATGETQIVDHEVSDQYKGIPLLILDEIHLKQ